MQGSGPFGDIDGRFLSPVVHNTNYEVTTLAVQPDGSWLVGGSFCQAPYSKLLRCDAAGGPESMDTFGPVIGGLASTVSAIAVLDKGPNEGKILIAGILS